MWLYGSMDGWIEMASIVLLSIFPSKHDSMYACIILSEKNHIIIIFDLMMFSMSIKVICKTQVGHVQHSCGQLF